MTKNCRLFVGTRDAIHVPIIAAKHKHIPLNQRGTYIKPGSYVKFTNAEFTEFEICEKKDAQGVVNPFLEEIYYYDTVIILLSPGITTPVRHNFDINPDLKEIENTLLQAELEAAKAADPDCAGCWHIKNNEVIRS